MAAKKTSSSKSAAKAPKSKAKTAAKKSPAKARKTSAKKTVAKVSTRRKAAPKAAKKTTARKSTASKSVRKTVSASRSQSSSRSPVVVTKTRRSSWMVIITSIVLLVIAIGGMLYNNPQIWEELQANLLAQTGVEVTSEETAGWLISRGPEDENARKLREIFSTVFPDLQVNELHYLSEEGKSALQQYGLNEVPNIIFSKASFESQTLAPVVEELFVLKNENYVLNTALVNPSNQLLVGMNPTTEEVVKVGSDQAPITMVVYSEPKCQHCRVMEQNNMEAFKQWADKGVVQLVMMDLPQSRVGMLPAEAIHCMQDISPENYFEFRQKLFAKPNLTDIYTKREFQSLSGQDFEVCKDRKKLFSDRQRQADKDGITGIPAIMVGKTGEQEWLRFTGSSEDSDFYLNLIKDLDPSALPAESPPATDDESDNPAE